MDFQFSPEFAQSLDDRDTLALFRNEFHIPKWKGEPVIYFAGNSLGLQPKGVRSAVLDELDSWAQLGVEGHFQGKNPWLSYHERFAHQTAELVGALPHEVVVMNGLTTNLHLMMVSFFRPSGKRTKILCEQKAFPSDQYAIESQLRFHGLDPEAHTLFAAPREGEYLIREEDLRETIRRHGEEIALVLLGGVHYYTGEFFNLEAIARTARDAGCLVGFDLAHAVGNIPLQLHQWGPDFACWCTYKYLNSGPGGISGVFVHERHAKNSSLPRFAGWWGHDKQLRFRMESGFRPIEGAEGWQLSNAPVLSMAAHKSSLDLFTEAGMPNLREKSLLLTSYLEFILDNIASRVPDTGLEIITPRDTNRRGCQLSVLVRGKGRTFFKHLGEQGVVADWREPEVVRMAPVPLYNSFWDIYRFGERLVNSLT